MKDTDHSEHKTYQLPTLGGWQRALSLRIVSVAAVSAAFLCSGCTLATDGKGARVLAVGGGGVASAGGDNAAVYVARDQVESFGDAVDGGVRAFRLATIAKAMENMTAAWERNRIAERAAVRDVELAELANKAEAARAAAAIEKAEVAR